MKKRILFAVLIVLALGIVLGVGAIDIPCGGDYFPPCCTVPDCR